MKTSNDERVNIFLEETNILNGVQFNTLQELRKIVFRIYPKASERMMYGGIMFTLDDDFGGIFTRKNHISFEFGNGYKMEDPNKLLEGSGKFRRHLKIKSFSDIHDKSVEYFVKQAVQFS